MNRYSTLLLLGSLTMATFARADALDGLFDNSIVSSISQALNDAWHPDDGRNNDGNNVYEDDSRARNNDNERRRYEDRYQQLEDRYRQLDDRQRQLDQERRQLDDEKRRLEDEER